MSDHMTEGDKKAQDDNRMRLILAKHERAIQDSIRDCLSELKDAVPCSKWDLCYERMADILSGEVEKLNGAT